MEQYILKSALIAEIEKRIKELQDLFKEDDKKLDSFQKAAIYLCIDECKVVLSIIDTLKVREVEHSADSVIEKAINFLEMLGYGFTITDNITHTDYDKKQLIEDFKNYIRKE